MRAIILGTVAIFVFLFVSFTAWWTRNAWLPANAQQWLSSDSSSESKEGANADGHDHTGHDHGAGSENSLELSPQARLNVGLTANMIQPITLREYTRTINVPGVVVGIPGQTEIKVPAPMTGVIMNVFAVEGQTVDPGTPLFKIRLVHEDLVRAQSDYLKSLGELDVEDKEITRLKKLTDNGAVAQRVLLERMYEKHKLEAVMRAQYETLLLHGLSKQQVDEITKERKLKSEFTVYAPQMEMKSGDMQAFAPSSASLVNFGGDSQDPPVGIRLVVQKINANKGDFFMAGGTLAVLADYRMLYVQGQAFEQDADELARAVENNWTVDAVIENNRQQPLKVTGLPIVYLDNTVEPDSRALHFFARLPNEILPGKKAAQPSEFVRWRYKPGQRMQVLVPVEKWQKRFVLPVDAVAKDGAEYYVFVENGSHFDRRPVHVLYRDQFEAVIANDGSLFPGDRVAMTGAHQMLIDMKNKAGGGVDPHAGHNH